MFHLYYFHIQVLNYSKTIVFLFLLTFYIFCPLNKVESRPDDDTRAAKAAQFYKPFLSQPNSCRGKK